MTMCHVHHDDVRIQKRTLSNVVTQQRISRVAIIWRQNAFAYKPDSDIKAVNDSISTECEFPEGAHIVK